MSLLISIEQEKDKFIVVEGFTATIDNERITKKAFPCTVQGASDLGQFLRTNEIDVSLGYSTTNDVHEQKFDITELIDMGYQHKHDVLHYAKVRQTAIKFGVTVEQVNSILSEFNFSTKGY